ncbi:hypothetical protein BJ165DRAFT_1486880 [Panaeolus papilionaceus]|nr:hypothetical protein BJ165DRAFT_1486880 [Panaeolus papilionaceus]
MSTQQEPSTERLMMKDLTLVSIPDSAIQFENGRDGVFFRFIEALAGNDALGISKDQLDSVTQVITTYEMTEIDVWNGPGTSITRIGAEGWRIYILDTPGFSDSQISEFEIIEMVKEWMNAHNCSDLNDIFYLWPITDTRLPGTKRRTIEMLKLLAAINTDKPGSIKVITTMWDRLWNEQAIAAAEERFVHLQDHVWKDLRERGGLVLKFTNTHSSAIDCLNSNSRILFAVRTSGLRGSLRDETFGPHLYHDLLNRIQATQQRKDNIKAELSDPVVQSNEELKALIEEQLHKVERLLTKFEGQLIAFGDPPMGFEEAIPFVQSIVKKHRRAGRVATFRKAKSYFTSKLRDVGNKIRK